MHRGETAELAILTESDVERVIRALRAIDHESAWTRVLEVGRVVFEGLGAGDEAHWRSRRGTKHLSLRRLVEHPACPFKKTALGDAVNVHLFVRQNPSLPELSGLSPTHVMRVVGLPSGQALSLLRATVEHGWTVRELGAKVQAVKRTAGERRGRPAATAAWKARRLALRAAAALRELKACLDSSETFDDRQSASVVASLDEVAEIMAQIRSLPALGRRSAVLIALAKPAARGSEDHQADSKFGPSASRSVPGRH
jgi:hypothetical protein